LLLSWSMRIDKAISSISLINIRVVSCRVDLIDNHPGPWHDPPDPTHYVGGHKTKA